MYMFQCYSLPIFISLRVCVVLEVIDLYVKFLSESLAGSRAISVVSITHQCFQGLLCVKHFPSFHEEYKEGKDEILALNCSKFSKRDRNDS